MCIGALPACVCASHDASRGQKRVLNPLEPELQMAVSSYMGAGTEPRSAGKATARTLHC